MMQLPVPTPTSLRETGNQPVAAASLWSTISYFGNKMPTMITLPRDILDFGGDELIISTVASMNVYIVAFTCYLWNVERSLFIAGELKKQIDCTIIVGGPEVTHDNHWLRSDPRWDIAITGEGEGPWQALLSGTSGWEHAFLSRVISEKDSCIAGEPIGTIPPHHTWNPLMDRQDGIPFIETGRGCTSRCAFCTYGDHRYPKRIISIPALRREIEAIHSMNVSEVFLLDPTLNRRTDIVAFLNVLRESELRFSAEIDGYSVDPAMAVQFALSGIHEVEIGLQSSIPAVRKSMGCPGDIECILRGAQLLTDQGISVRIDLIFGLPNDTEHDLNEGIEMIRHTVPQADIQLFPLLVLPGSRVRMEAGNLGLKYRDRPPYSVYATPAIGEERIQEAWDLSSMLAASHEYEPPPDLYTGSGSGFVITRIFVQLAPAVYINPEQLGIELGSQLGNSITVRVRRDASEEKQSEWLHTFLRSLLRRNPYTCTNLVFDRGYIMSRREERMFQDSIRQPWHYLERRSLEYRDGTGRIYVITEDVDTPTTPDGRTPRKSNRLLQLRCGNYFETHDKEITDYPIGRTAFVPNRCIWEDVE